MSPFDPVAHLVAFIAALALVALGWWAQRLVATLQSAPSVVTVGAGIPLWLRLVWWCARILAHEIGPKLSMRFRAQTLQQLQTADLDQFVGPEHWIAGRVSLSLLVGVLALTVAIWFDLAAFAVCVVTLFVTWIWSGYWLRERRAAIHRAVHRELPTYLDVLTLGVESGASLSTALSICVEKSIDSPLRRAFVRVIGEVRAGRTRAEALANLEQRMRLPAITSLATALAHAERTGASVGSVLRVQADQRSAERFARAEKLAMEAPVKMLGPLILCIFPCTFLVLGFPIAVQLIRSFG